MPQPRTMAIHCGRLREHLVRQLFDCMATRNAKKLKGHRRGTLLLSNFTYANGVIILEWREDFIRGFRLPNKPQQDVYRHTDHRLLIKRLKEESTCLTL